MKYKDIIKDPTWIKDIKCGVVNENGLTNYLLRNIPGILIAQCLASYIFDDVNGGSDRIVITEDVLKKHFRIQGFTSNYHIEGEKENRGNYSQKQ